MFYGREIERKKLCTMFQTDGQMISLIYGRRRIGKSELIKQVLKETEIKSIYYECKQTTEQNNVDSLAELIGELFEFPKPAFENMEVLLQFLFQKAEKEQPTGYYHNGGRHCHQRGADSAHGVQCTDHQFQES